jgi:hypothetical protein
VLKWAGVPLTEPGEGQIGIKVKAAGIGPTDLDLRAGYLKHDIPLPRDAVLGFEAAGTVDAVGPGVSGVSAGGGVTAGLADRVRALGLVDAVLDAAGKGLLTDAIAWRADPSGSSPCQTRPPRTSASRSPSPTTSGLPLP